MALQLAQVRPEGESIVGFTCEVSAEKRLVLELRLRKQQGGISSLPSFDISFADHKEEFREFLLNSYRFLYTNNTVSFILTLEQGVTGEFHLYATGETERGIQMLIVIDHETYDLIFTQQEFGDLVLKIDDYYR